MAARSFHPTHVLGYGACQSEGDMTKDCLLIGFNDTDFPTFVEMIRGMGVQTGTFRDLNLAYTELDGQPYRCLDLLNRLLADDGLAPEKPFENCDFVWPVILYLGSYLRRRGLSFDYVGLFHREKEKLREMLAANRYGAIAITTTVYVSPHPIIEIIRFLRECGATAPIVVGGPYISNQDKVLDEAELKMLFDYLGADMYVVSSEGEATLARTLQALKEGSDLAAIPNLVLRQGEEDFVFHPKEVEQNSLEHEPVEYGLFGADALGQFVSLRTAKSCPFACAFCGFPQRAGKYTYTDLAHIEREFDAIAEVGSVTTLTFLDDTFNVPKARFKQILRLMIERGYGFKWNSFYRSDHGDEETIDLMAASGCEGVFLGIESGCDAMLERMNKTSRKKNYAFAIDRFRKVGISTYGSFIIGFPGESEETVAETIEFIEEQRPSYYRAQLFYLDPATPVWRDREKFGITGGGFEWKHPTMDADRASDLIEHMFCTIRNSSWSPQHGFEDWSTYYLQRHGFTRAEVHAFVDGFNRLVRRKFPGYAETISEAQTLAEMRGVARTARLRYLETGPPAPARKRHAAPRPIAGHDAPAIADAAEGAVPAPLPDTAPVPVKVHWITSPADHMHE